VCFCFILANMTHTVWAYDQKDNLQSASFLHPLLLIQLKIILKFDIVNLMQSHYTCVDKEHKVTVNPDVWLTKRYSSYLTFVVIGRTAVCHKKPVFWRAYKNEWPISWNYEYIIFGQIIFQNFQNTGFLWHTAVRPSVHASYNNISHLFPLLLIGHVVTYIVLIKGGASVPKLTKITPLTCSPFYQYNVCHDVTYQ
jgi:hypothetical protein